MKIILDIDCTPDEARQFLGLPNVQPMQQAVMAKLEKQVAEAVDAFSPQQLLQAWFAPQTMEQFTALFRGGSGQFQDREG